MKVKMEGDIDKAGQLSKGQPGETLKRYQNHIKRTIKNKITLYETLDFKTTLKGFFEWVQKEEYKVIREFRGDSTLEYYLYYYDEITNLSTLGRILGTSRYQAKKILKSVEYKVLMRKLKNNKNPPSYKDEKKEKKNDTPGS